MELFCAGFDDVVSMGDMNDLPEADIICTATSASNPLFDSSHIAKGTHINAVGAHGRTKRELPSELIQNARVYVDSFISSQSEAGNLIIPIEHGDYEWNRIECEIGTLINSNTEGRANESDITIFNSVGSAIQDLVISTIVMEKN